MTGRGQFARRGLKFYGGGITAAKDLRVAEGDSMSARPGLMQMLFKGGSSRAVGGEDFRMDRDDEDEIEPRNLKALSEGGELEEDEDGELTEGQLIAAEDMLEALGGFNFGEREIENDTKAERAGKQASRRAKAEMFGKALKAFFHLVDDD